MGTLTGSVTNSSTGEAIAGAQISIPGTGLGTLTNNVGRFVLLNVPGVSVIKRGHYGKAAIDPAFPAVWGVLETSGPTGNIRFWNNYI